MDILYTLSSRTKFFFLLNSYKAFYIVDYKIMFLRSNEKTHKKLGLGVECSGDLLKDGPLLVQGQPGALGVAGAVPAAPPLDVLTGGQVGEPVEGGGHAGPEGVAADGVPAVVHHTFQQGPEQLVECGRREVPAVLHPEDRAGAGGQTCLLLQLFVEGQGLRWAAAMTREVEDVQELGPA